MSAPAKVPAAIVGPGNIGTDLLAKLARSARIEVTAMVGVVESEGLERASAMGVAASSEGVDWLPAPGPAAPHRLRGHLGQGARGATRRATPRPASGRST